MIRSMSEVALKEATAWDMRVTGQSWNQIARVLGYPSARAAAGAVRVWQRRSAFLVDEATREEMLTEELAKLDMLQNAVWADAMQGEPSAVNNARQIILARAKLLGLDERVTNITNNTVVVAGDTQEYVNSLEAATR